MVIDKYIVVPRYSENATEISFHSIFLEKMMIDVKMHFPSPPVV